MMKTAAAAGAVGASTARRRAYASAAAASAASSSHGPSRLAPTPPPLPTTKRTYSFMHIPIPAGAHNLRRRCSSNSGGAHSSDASPLSLSTLASAVRHAPKFACTRTTCLGARNVSGSVAEVKEAAITTTSNDNDKDDTNGSSPLASFDLTHPDCNVTPTIASRVGTNLHLIPNHPLHTIKTIIEEYWNEVSSSSDGQSFATYDTIPPPVATTSNFDSLLIPSDHVSRSKSDTYYLNSHTVLRTHTSAHQTSLLSSGVDRFLVTGDVYRRDEIDSSHYPVFHQMEGVRMFTEDELDGAGLGQSDDPSEEELVAFVERDLKSGLEGMARELFGNVEMRWVDEYFPFTDPSYELEIYFRGEWMEVLGCGVIHRDIVRNVGRGRQPGWAFGLGLERLAMVLFEIPDIRLFWSQDERFHSQFESGKIVKFEPYSKYPPCFKDISFWTSSGSTATNTDATDAAQSTATFHPNDLYEVVRDVGGDLVERVELIDTFAHPKTGRISKCFRISYRSMDRSLTNAEVDEMQERVRDLTVEKLGVELR